MAQDNEPNKAVHLMFLCGGLLLFYLLQWTAEWIWGYFSRTPDEFVITAGAALVGLTVGIFAYRNEKAYKLASEVAAELRKVAWPTAKEVRQATIVVLWMTFISAGVLALFDTIWGAVTKFIYG